MTYHKACYPGGPGWLAMAFVVAVLAILLMLRLRSQGFVLHGALLALAPSTEDAVLSSMLAEGLVHFPALATLFVAVRALAVARRTPHRRVRWNTLTA